LTNLSTIQAVTHCLKVIIELMSVPILRLQRECFHPQCSHQIHSSLKMKP
jgi:hypothetical protein